MLRIYTHRVILRLKKKLLLEELITCLQFVSKRRKAASQQRKIYIYGHRHSVVACKQCKS